MGRKRVIPQKTRQAMHDEWMYSEIQVKDIAKKYKTFSSTVSHIIDEIAGRKIFKGKRRSDEDELQMQKLYKQGIPITEIAKRFKAGMQITHIIISKIIHKPDKPIFYDDYTEEEMLATLPASENFLDYIAKMNANNNQNLAQKLDTQYLKPSLREIFKGETL